jgi:hypothetical protein
MRSVEVNEAGYAIFVGVTSGRTRQHQRLRTHTHTHTHTCISLSSPDSSHQHLARALLVRLEMSNSSLRESEMDCRRTFSTWLKKSASRPATFIIARSGKEPRLFFHAFDSRSNVRVILGDGLLVIGGIGTVRGTRGFLVHEMLQTSLIAAGVLEEHFSHLSAFSESLVMSMLLPL